MLKMRKIKKQILAMGMAFVLAFPFVGLTGGKLVSAKPTDGESDLEIASRMVNSYHDIDEEPPISVSEYINDIPQDGISAISEADALDKYDPRTVGGGVACGKKSGKSWLMLGTQCHVYDRNGYLEE